MSNHDDFYEDDEPVEIAARAYAESEKNLTGYKPLRGVTISQLFWGCGREFREPIRVYIHLGRFGCIIVGARAQVWSPRKGYRGKDHWWPVSYHPDQSQMCMVLLCPDDPIDRRHCGKLKGHRGRHS